MTVFLLVMAIFIWVMGGIYFILGITFGGVLIPIVFITLIIYGLLGLLFFLARKRVLDNKAQVKAYQLSLDIKKKKLAQLAEEERMLEHKLWVKAHNMES